jgi:CubicO group peptidase (beta-lactamase class C family)
VIEVASGEPLDLFLESHLFKPLGMVDTGFYVPEAKLFRLVDPPMGGRAPEWDVTRPTKLFSGGGGLVSTAVDYLRFCQMLLNGGELDGGRFLAPTTILKMTTSSLPPDIRYIKQRRRGRACRRHELGTRVCDPNRSRVEHCARIGRYVHLGRRVGHNLLDRSTGQADRSANDPGIAQR